MSLLSDRELWKALGDGSLSIAPRPKRDEIQPASVELHLGTHFWRYKYGDAIVDPTEDTSDHFMPFTSETAILPVGGFILGHTVEWVEVGSSLAVKVEGCSSLGRLGLKIHCTAGFVDPGFKGNITLELANLSPRPIRLHRSMVIGQLVAERLTGPAERPYGTPGLGSRYQYSNGAVRPVSAKARGLGGIVPFDGAYPPDYDGMSEEEALERLGKTMAAARIEVTPGASERPEA
jgi:dCTP deaminase